MKKRILTLLLCLSVLFSLVVPALAEGISEPGYQEPVKPEVAVNYYNGAELLVTQYIKPGEALVYPDVPTCSGAYFVGWGYDETTAINPQLAVLPSDYSEDALNLYAVFAPYPNVTLTVNFLDRETKKPVSRPIQLKLPEDLAETNVLPTELPTVYGYALDTEQLVKDAEHENIYYIIENNELIKIEYKTEDGVTVPVLRYDFADLATTAENELTFNLYYKSGEANYTVEHWVENADDNDYTLVSSDIKNGRVNMWTNAAARTDLGDGIILRDDVEQTQITGDGSSVVKIYYEREYYMITFDANGGIDAPNPIYGKFGAAVGSVTHPTRAGYNFTGWSPAMPPTIPAKNTELVAQWQLKGPTATAKVIIWGENANDDGYSLLNSYSVTGTVGSLVYMNSSGTLYTGSSRAYVCGLPEHQHHYSGTYKGGFFNLTTYYYGGCFPGSNGSGGLKSDELTDANATCGMINHTHSNSCYTYSNALYTFYFSESKKILADGTTVVNVYYNRKTFTWSFYKKSSSSNALHTITAKWGEEVYSQWNACCRSTGYVFWTSNDSSGITIIRTHMTQYDVKFYGDKTKNDASYYYYVEALPGTTTGGVNYKGTYYVRKYVAPCKIRNTVADVAKIPITGFTYSVYVNNHNKQENSGQIYFEGINFYYKRNSYKLTFNNGQSDVRNYTVPYETALSKYGGFTPARPSTVDSDYIFEGWYYNAECTRKVNLSSDTMPAGNLILYANWVPPTYTVDSYKVEVFSNTNLINSEEVEKNNFATEPSAVYDQDYNPGYAFVGWFYLSDGVEIPFSFKMPITQDYKVYAKWRPTITADYYIRHINDDDGSVLKELAASALVGRSVNGYAEFGMTDADGNMVYLIPGEKTSKSIVLIQDGQNVIEFHYSRAFSASYVVKTVDENGTTLLPPQSEQSIYTVTTVYAPYVRGYTPKEAYKIVSLNGTEEAEVTFVYTENEAKTYTAQYWFESIDGSEYVRDASMDADYSAPLGSMIYMDGVRNRSFDGFKVNFEASDWRGIAGRDSVLNLKFDRRRDCVYTVHYYLNGTTTRLAEDKVVSNAVYEAEITENAIEISGFAPYGEKSKSFTVSMVNEDIIFYYEEIATIRYEAVVLNGNGLMASVDPTQEQFGKLSAKPTGSRAVYDETLIFLGWFDNASGTGTALSVNDSFVPAPDAQGEYLETYYAVFKPNFFTLIVEKPVNASGQSSFYTVSWTENGEVKSLQFIMDADDTRQVIERISRSSTVTVTQNNTWTWRYGVAYSAVSNEPVIAGTTTNSVTFNPTAAEHTVSFTESLNNSRWIAGDLYKSALVS